MTFPIITDTGEWNTTWPLQASFPLFLRNVLYALGNLNEAATEENDSAGSDQDASAGRLCGQYRSRQSGRQTTKTDPRRPRIAHRLQFRRHRSGRRLSVHRAGRRARSFAVNLLDAEESNIEPRPIITIGSDRIEAGKEHGQPREMWKWFAVVALALLMLEWYVYNRRIYI